MYQRCTKPAVHNGKQRGTTGTCDRSTTVENRHLPGKMSQFGNGLITQRSQVQILPPPPSEGPGQRPGPSSRVAGRHRRCLPARDAASPLTWPNRRVEPVDVCRLAPATSAGSMRERGGGSRGTTRGRRCSTRSRILMRAVPSVLSPNPSHCSRALECERGENRVVGTPIGCTRLARAASRARCCRPRRTPS